jgi:hypothetical protein
MRLFGHSKSRERFVVLPLDDPKLAELARRLADFAEQHTGHGHELRRVAMPDDGQTVVCRCGAPPERSSPERLLALHEDEIIDDG